MTGVAHRWRPITDLSDAAREAASDELPALAATWDEVQGRLDPAQVAQFNERLQREWAIETGIIERLYTLDRGTTQLLIERGIDASLIAHADTDQPPEFVAGLISDQQSAVDWLFDFVKQQRQLTTSFVKELHAHMTGRQEHTEARDPDGRAVRVQLRHGDYKLHANNPTRADGSVHEYCPPEHVAAEMDRLVDLHHEHQRQAVAAEVEAAWLHHRFTQIHPFQDGNGRVARALASLVLIRAGWFPLVITRDDRSDYIAALEEADRGDLRPLTALFVRVEKRSFLRALSIAEQVHAEGERVDQLLDVIGDMFGRRDLQARAELDKAKDLAGRLRETARQRLEQVRAGLEQRLSSGATQRRFFVDQGDDDDAERRIWNRFQVIETANVIDYFANTREYHEWLRLCFVTESGRSELLLSFHGIGPEYRGLIGVSMTFYRRQEGEDIQSQLMELQPASDELFQVNYKDDPATTERRFVEWLEASLVRGLDQWRRGE